MYHLPHIHIIYTLLQLDAKTDPFNSDTGSEFVDLDFPVTPCTLSKSIFSTSDSASIPQIGVDFP